MSRRRAGGLALVALAVLAFVSPTEACRCAQRTLGEYFEAADEVFVGRLEAERVEGDRRMLEFALAGPRHKAPSGEPKPYASHTSSASCAVPAEIGATYVVFAAHDAVQGVAWLSSCEGTRVLRSADGELREGFDDVPARFVSAQLDALAGLEALGEVAANEPSPDDAASEGLVGLLEIDPILLSAGLELRAAPEREAGIVAEVASYEELDHRESSYEVRAAVVLATDGDWLKLRRAGGETGWVEKPNDARYLPYDELPVNALAYLTAAWSGFVWPEPGAGLPTRSSLVDEPPQGRVEIPVRVLESRRLAGSLWFRVEVLSSSPCELGTPRVVLAGWTPAYGRDGAPAAWFYSRGC